MMNLTLTRRTLTPLKLLSVCGFAALSACSSSPDPRLYLMKSANGPVISQSSSNISVLVGPIVMPEHLKRSEIVYKSNAHDISVNEFDRWAESLERNMTSVITSNLATHLGTDKAFDYYANFSTKPDYLVRLNVTEFSRVSPDTVSLSASWELVNKSSGQSHLYSENIKTSIEYSGDDKNIANVSNVIAAMNTALNDLSLKISNQIIDKSSQI